MKLRITRGGLRLRLSARDISALVHAGSVAESVQFPGGSVLSFGVEAAGDQVGARFAEGQVRVRVPAWRVNAWAEAEDVLLCNSRLEGTRVVVEKDLPCRHPRQ